MSEAHFSATDFPCLKSENASNNMLLKFGERGERAREKGGEAGGRERGERGGGREREKRKRRERGGGVERANAEKERGKLQASLSGLLRRKS